MVNVAGTTTTSKWKYFTERDGIFMECGITTTETSIVQDILGISQNFCLDASGLFLHFRRNCCPPPCDCPSSIPSIYHLHFHRKSPSDSPHSTSHCTLFTENLAVAILKFPQIKIPKSCSLENAKNFSLQTQIKAPLKWRSEIFFSGYPLGLANDF